MPYKSHFVRSGCGAFACVLISACGTMSLSEIEPRVIPSKSIAAIGTKSSTCSPTVLEATLFEMQSRANGSEKHLPEAAEVQYIGALTSVMSVAVQNQRIKDLKDNLSDFGDDAVVGAMLTALGRAVNNTQGAVASRLNTSAFGKSDPAYSSPPKDIDEWDIRAFAQKVRNLAFAAPRSYGARSSQGESNSANIASGASHSISDALVSYFKDYYQGKFYDRFGNAIPAPQLSRTIGDTEIAGVITVFSELILDEAVDTPVWTSSSGGVVMYYPGATKNQPTAVKYKLASSLPLLDDNSTTSCGITALKAEAVHYIAQHSGARASMLAGTVGGSFGGLHIGFGVLGKWSIGDNQTLQTLAKTALEEIFTRAGEEASYRSLYWIGYQKPDPTDPYALANLVQKYLDDSGQKP